MIKEGKNSKIEQQINFNKRIRTIPDEWTILIIAEPCQNFQKLSLSNCLKNHAAWFIQNFKLVLFAHLICRFRQKCAKNISYFMQEHLKVSCFRLKSCYFIYSGIVCFNWAHKQRMFWITCRSMRGHRNSGNPLSSLKFSWLWRTGRSCWTASILVLSSSGA